MLKIQVAILEDTGGCCWFTSSRVALRMKDGGSTLWKGGGASSLSEWSVEEEAGDSLDRLMDPLVDIV